jgi:hypothetical protein
MIAASKMRMTLSVLPMFFFMMFNFSSYKCSDKKSLTKRT